MEAERAIHTNTWKIIATYRTVGVLLFLAALSASDVAADIVRLESQPQPFASGSAHAKLTVEEIGDTWRPLSLELFHSDGLSGSIRYDVPFSPYPDGLFGADVTAIRPPDLGAYRFFAEHTFNDMPLLARTDSGYRLGLPWGGDWRNDDFQSLGGFQEGTGVANLDFVAVNEPSSGVLAFGVSLCGLVAVRCRRYRERRANRNE